MKHLPVIGLLIFGALTRMVLAQEVSYRFERLGLDEGLSQSTISAIWQDHKGFIWVGTRNGLNLYDGYQFTIYKNEPNNPRSLSDNWITAICEDRSENFWVATTNKGLNLFDRAMGIFYGLSADSNSPVILEDNAVIALSPAKEGIWVATKKGVENIGATLEAGKIKFWKKKAFDKAGIVTLYVDRAGRMWVGSKSGLELRTEGGVTTYRHDETDPSSLSNNAVNAVEEDSAGYIWVATDNGLNRLDPASGRFTRFSFATGKERRQSDNYVMSLYCDRLGDLWVGTNVGLHRLNRDGSFTSFRHDQADPYSISNNEVRSIFEDRSRILWIGTFGGGGLNKLDLKRQKFRHYRNEENNVASLSNNVVRGFYEARDGGVWIGTHDGLNRLDPASGQFKRYPFDKNNPAGLSHPEARSMAEDDRGFLWIGTEGGGLDRLDPKTGSFVHHRNDKTDPNSLGQNEISSLVLTGGGVLWIGTFGRGVDYVDINTGRLEFKHLRNDPADEASLGSNQVSALFLDRASSLWVGSFGGGVSRITLDERGFPVPGKITRLRHDPNDAGSLSSDVVFTIAQDDAGDIWIGTSAGVCRMVTTDDKTSFVRYSESDGLPDNYVYGALPDSKGQLWLTTVRGLSCLRVDRVSPAFEKKGTVRNYDVKDGLQSNEFKYGAYHRGRSGTLYIGGTNGFNMFQPEEIEDNGHIPPIVLTKFKIYNSEDLSWLEPGRTSVTYKNRIELKYNEDFSFEFSALDYTNPERNEYAYYMEGFDKDWIMSGSRRFVNYTNLDQGRYTFHVRGSNNDGVWNLEGAAIEIIIVPPFWKTWWFRLCMAAALALIAYTWFRVHIHNIEASNRRLENEVAERTREIQRQRDDLKQINEKLETTLKTLHSTQSQLLHAEKMSAIGQMVAGIAHEINNPLTFVDGNLHILEEHVMRWDRIIQEYGKLIESNDLDKIRAGLKGVKESHEYDYTKRDTVSILESCRKGSQRIKAVVQELQKFSRIDTTALEPYDVHDGINITLTMLKPQYIDRVEVIRNFGKLPFIEAAPGLVNQVFLNIISNAIEAITGRGTIEVTTFREDQQVVVSIRDSGKGIAPSMIKSVFDPFFTTKEIGRGVGLGLSVSYGIVKKHGGDIRVESTPGVGSTFSIVLPIKGHQT